MMSEGPRLMVVVLVFIEQDGALLLVQQDYGERYWSLPGGQVELGESLEQAAIREVKEETGLDARITRVVGLYSKPKESALAITFEGECIGSILRPDHEISECGYFPFDALPTPIRAHLSQRIADYRCRAPQAVLRTQ